MAESRSTRPRAKAGHYVIKHDLFWAVLLGIAIPTISGTFYVGQLIGNTKFDISSNEIRETNRVLKDSLVLQRKVIKRMQFVSDSALNILGHMPYEEMQLDTLEFRKVQNNIENAGAALYLNINYKR